jgi:hypothetical protein
MDTKKLLSLLSDLRVTLEHVRFRYPETQRLTRGALEAIDSALSPETDGCKVVNYLHHVPDVCDRIVWRDRYYSLERLEALPEVD